MALSKRPGPASPTQAKVHDSVVREAVGYKRLNAPIPADLYKQIQQRALDEDRSIAEITRELWQRYLQEGGNGR
jgi:hypothetical protein